MVDLKTQTPANIHTETIRECIKKAKAGDLQGALSEETFKALASLKSDRNTLGLYLNLLGELVGAHKSIRKSDIEAAVRELLPDDEKDTAGRISAADEIVALAIDACTLFTDQEDEAHAIIAQDGHREIWPVNSSAFREWVSMLLYRTAGKTPRAASLADAFSTLNGIAKHDGEKHLVHLRVAADGSGGYYLDIGDEQWRVIHITPRGWQILNESPVLFRRSKQAKPVPIPLAGGTLADLKALANVEDVDDLLLVTVLIDYLRPDTAYPVTELIGEQGSGKSTTAENMRRLIDPKSVNLKSKTKSVEDLFINARNNHFVCLNNLSRLSGDEQDAICNLSTGGGYASRKLYTNDEEVTYEAKRPVLLNGINPVTTQSDLVSRVVRIECPSLEDSATRLDDRELADVFKKRAPLALGFLLDTMAEALSVLPSIELSDKPRLMDFARLGAAVGRVLDPDAGELAFTNRYREAQEAASLQALDGMPVIVALLEYLGKHAPYTGNYAGLLKSIEDKIGKTMDAAWPKSGRGLSDAIGRAKPTLNFLGWEVSTAGRSKNGANVTIKKKPVSVKINNPELPSTTNTTSTERVNGAGGAGGAGEIPRVYSHATEEKCAPDDYRAAKSGSRGGVL